MCNMFVGCVFFCVCVLSQQYYYPLQQYESYSRPHVLDLGHSVYVISFSLLCFNLCAHDVYLTQKVNVKD